MLSMFVRQPKAELPSISTCLILLSDMVMGLGLDREVRVLVSSPLAVGIEDLHTNETELFRLNGELVLHDANLDDLAGRFVLCSSTISSF
jgi:hypothetical protein